MKNNKDRIEIIKQRLEQAFHPTLLKVIDESHLHVGHEGAKTGLGHFALEITSSAFSSKNKIEQHRMIYAALGDLMKTDIHAIRISSQSSPK